MPRGAGWYRGDLHCHTHHSDADGLTVAELIQTARDYELDFVFLTDHNTTAGLAEMDASATENLLTAGGIELTTSWGHALYLGGRDWVDWRIPPGTGDIARIAPRRTRMIKSLSSRIHTREVIPPARVVVGALGR